LNSGTDACNGDSFFGRYSYQFWGHATKDYDSCSMSCSDSAVSDIVGVARDGFAIYGPMQYYSEFENKIYIDRNKCNDCKLVQINGDQTDHCGGIEAELKNYKK